MCTPCSRAFPLFFPKYTERRKQHIYMCSTETMCPLSHSYDLALINYAMTENFICFLLFTTTSKGTIMEIRSLDLLMLSVPL